MSFAHFRCNADANAIVVDNSSTSLCLNGGVCRIVLADLSMTQFCECPPGFIHDFTVGHFPNCGMPETALPIMFAIVTVVTVLSVVYTLRVLRTLRSRAFRRIAIIVVVNTVIAWAMYLAVFIQQGRFTATVALWLILNMLIFRTLVELVLITTEPIYSMLKQTMKRFRQLLLWIEFVNFILQLAATIPVIIFVADGNPDRFNLAMAIFLSVSTLTQTVMAIVTYLQSGNLRKEIQAIIAQTAATTASSDRMSSFIARLEQMEKADIAAAAVNTVQLTFPICFIVLGSLPGQFALSAILHIVFPMLGMWAVYLLKSSNNQSSKNNRSNIKQMAAVDGTL